MISRRSLIRGVGALLAAPAIVRASSLMAVRSTAPSLMMEYSVSYVGPGAVSVFLEGSRNGMAWFAVSKEQEIIGDGSPVSVLITPGAPLIRVRSTTVIPRGMRLDG